MMERVRAHPCNEAGSLMEEASDVLFCVIVDIDGHVGEVPLVEAGHDGRRVQDMGDASHLEAIQVACRPYGPCISRLSM